MIIINKNRHKKKRSEKTKNIKLQNMRKERKYKHDCPVQMVYTEEQHRKQGKQLETPQNCQV